MESSPSYGWKGVPASEKWLCRIGSAILKKQKMVQSDYHACYVK